jgi:hypothetical protein
MAIQAYFLPAGYQTLEDATGASIPGGLVWTYQAGTSTPAATYTDATLTVPNSNPIVCDGAGRWTAWGGTGAVYKLVFEGPATPPAHGPILKTVDGLQLSSAPALTLLKSDTGTYAAAAAAQLSTVTIPAGLAMTDTLIVFCTFSVGAGTGATGALQLLAGATLLSTINPGVAINTAAMSRVVIKTLVPNTGQWLAMAEGLTNNSVRVDNGTASAPGVWTAGFLLALQLASPGIPAGASLFWQWQVYKLSSQ